jgi:hypothetical protein
VERGTSFIRLTQAISYFQICLKRNLVLYLFQRGGVQGFADQPRQESAQVILEHEMGYRADIGSERAESWVFASDPLAGFGLAGAKNLNLAAQNFPYKVRRMSGDDRYRTRFGQQSVEQYYKLGDQVGMKMGFGLVKQDQSAVFDKQTGMKSEPEE